MKTPRHIVAATLAQQSLGDLKGRQFAQEIAAYLIENHRVQELDSIMRDIVKYRAEHGIVEVVAASAHPLTDAIRQDIETQVKRVYPAAKQIIISYEADDSLVGGVRLTIADEQLDLSVRNKLNHFKQLTA